MNHKQKLGYMALGPVVEASYEIVKEYETTTGYLFHVLFWTIRFDKPPHGLRVKNALEYTLFDTELHIVASFARLSTDFIIVLWDGGKKIFVDPFSEFWQGDGSITVRYDIDDDYQLTGYIIKFRRNSRAKNVVLMSVAVDGVGATEIEYSGTDIASQRGYVSQWKVDVNVPEPEEKTPVTLTWTLTNGIRGSLTFDSDSIRSWE